jgi:aminopeptidase
MDYIEMKKSAYETGAQVTAILNDLDAIETEQLDRLAEIAIRVGVNLAGGQELVMTAPIAAVPLTRAITTQAYRAGASLVTTLFTDEEATLSRFRNARGESFDRAADWLESGIAAAYRSGAARLAVAGANPNLLSGIDPDRTARAYMAQSKAMKPALDLIVSHSINWSIVPCATPAWAQAVFPDEPEDAAIARLWRAIFDVTRADAPDPIAAWQAHDAQLHRRADWMNQKRFTALRFKAPGTDLHVGLADDHLWLGGGTLAHNGIHCIPNLPTEEIFTTPHKERVDGFVSSTKPLSHQGSLIDGIRVRFEDGRIVEAHAALGEELLRKILQTDEGAAHLGEVGLVPASSPVARTGLLFQSTLLDENAATHIALGRAYSTCIRGGDKLDSEQLAARGANDSLIHIDWMIGSSEMDIDGIDAHNVAQPVMRRGEWVA